MRFPGHHGQHWYHWKVWHPFGATGEQWSVLRNVAGASGDDQVVVEGENDKCLASREVDFSYY